MEYGRADDHEECSQSQLKSNHQVSNVSTSFHLVPDHLIFVNSTKWKIDVLLQETDETFQTVILQFLLRFWRQDFLIDFRIEVKFQPPNADLEEMSVQKVELIVQCFGVEE